MCLRPEEAKKDGSEWVQKRFYQRRYSPHQKLYQVYCVRSKHHVSHIVKPSLPLWPPGVTQAVQGLVVLFLLLLLFLFLLSFPAALTTFCEG